MIALPLTEFSPLFDAEGTRGFIVGNAIEQRPSDIDPFLCGELLKLMEPRLSVHVIKVLLIARFSTLADWAEAEVRQIQPAVPLADQLVPALRFHRGHNYEDAETAPTAAPRPC